MMTIDECMAKATAHFDEIVADGLRKAAEVITTHGDPTPEEYEAFMHFQAQQLYEWRANQIARLRSWLERNAQTLQ